VRLVAMKILLLIAQDSVLENVMKKMKYGIAGVRSGTILLKPGRIHWKAILN
jgi:hypothetical protein